MLRIFGGIWQQVKLEQNIVIYFMGLVVNYIYLLLDITKRIYVILFSPVSIEQVRTLVVTRPRTISFASVVILISMCGTVKLFSEGQ